MKTSKTKIAVGLFITTGLILLGCKKDADIEASYLPLDVQKTCTVSKADFDTWFASGKATENGLVSPANSVTFPHQNNCDFYKWSHQMFLWITSPASGSYGNTGTIMESPVFYNVSPPYDVSKQNPHGVRKLVPHTPGELLRVTPHISQNGPNKLPVIIDKQGRMFEVETSQDNEVTFLKNAKNELVAIKSLVNNEKRGIDFLDAKGKVIEQPKAVIKSKINPNRVVHSFKLGKKQIFLDASGNQIETEQGQAGSNGALMAENKSLVYYITMVNDVYAYYLSGVNEGKLNNSQFPTTQKELNSILAYAKVKGLPNPPDANALAMELKTSWVETTNLPNAKSYVTIKAIIPTYNKSNPNKWVVNGERTATLALVGMHVVGSVAGHPEMIWATFEHQKNTPNEAYSYKDTKGQIKEVPADKGTGWLFNANASDQGAQQNFQNMRVSGDTILITNPEIYSPGARRIMAWGSASNTVPNPEDKTPADANSQVISINNDIRSLLVGNDIRKNYLLIGATWTFGGNAPNGASYPYAPQVNNQTPTDSIPTPAPLGDAIGTAQLSNSTMETYVQSPSSASTSANSISCFSCHNNKNGLAPGDLSHVFGETKTILPIVYTKGKK